MNSIFICIGEKIRRYKVLFCCLIVATITISIIAIYSAINFETISITIDVGNVTFVKFLTGETSFLPLIFGLMIMAFVFIGICCFCCLKKILVPLAVLVYFYFVYSQMVVLTSLIVIYGFFNTLVLIFFLSCFLLMEFFLFMLVLLELISNCGSPCFFKDCFSVNSCIKWLLVFWGVLILIFCTILALLKSFVLLLVF